MLSHVLDLRKQITDWQFVELWVDLIVFIPRILMLACDKNCKCGIYDPAANYQTKVDNLTYDQAHS